MSTDLPSWMSRVRVSSPAANVKLQRPTRSQMRTTMGSLVAARSSPGARASAQDEHFRSTGTLGPRRRGGAGTLTGSGTIAGRQQAGCLSRSRYLHPFERRYVEPGILRTPTKPRCSPSPPIGSRKVGSRIGSVPESASHHRHELSPTVRGGSDLDASRTTTTKNANKVL
jgi:hypothetical protein